MTMIDIIIILIYLTLGSILLITLWSVVKRLRTTGKMSGTKKGIPVTKINVTVNIIVLTLLASTFFLTGTASKDTGGDGNVSEIWLRITNMFVTTGLFVLALAIVATIAGAVMIGKPKEFLTSLLPFKGRHGKNRKRGEP